MKQILLGILMCAVQVSVAQDVKPFVAEGDATYFDFWEGTWYELKADNSLDSSVCFKIKRGVHAASFLEEWQLSSNMKSMAIRAWDKSTNKWGFVWVSNNGLYQVWDTRKIDGNWYLYRPFNINGDAYLSRQSFILQPDGTVLRRSEKTYDEKNWELRFQQRLKKAGS